MLNNYFLNSKWKSFSVLEMECRYLQIFSVSKFHCQLDLSLQHMDCAWELSCSPSYYHTVKSRIVLHEPEIETIVERAKLT